MRSKQGKKASGQRNWSGPNFAPLPGLEAWEKQPRIPRSLERVQTLDCRFSPSQFKPSQSPSRPKDLLLSLFSAKALPPLDPAAHHRPPAAKRPCPSRDKCEFDRELREKHDLIREGQGGLRLKAALHRRKRLVVDQGELFTIQKVLRVSRPSSSEHSADCSFSESSFHVAALFHNESIRSWIARPAEAVCSRI